MLYVFHGTDIGQSRGKAHTLVDSLRTKRPDAAYEQVNADNWNTSLIESHLGGQGLFSNKYIVFFDRVTENEDAKDGLLEFLEPMNESPNIFIVLEGRLDAELKKAVAKHAERAVVSDKAAENRVAAGGGAGTGGRADFNIFALADAVGSRDSLKAWTIYRQAVLNGLESESILGTLFWQVKSMALAREAPSAAGGLSPFVFSKAKRAAGNYSEAELKDLMGRLITMYHDGHRGALDLELAAERMMLGL